MVSCKRSWYVLLCFMYACESAGCPGSKGFRGFRAPLLGTTSAECIAASSWPQRGSHITSLPNPSFGNCHLEPTLIARGGQLASLIQAFTTIHPIRNTHFDSCHHFFQQSAAGSALNLTLPRILLPPAFKPPFQSRPFARKRMPPKKQAEEKKILLGRPGNSLKSGIVCTSPQSPDLVRLHH